MRTYDFIALLLALACPSALSACRAQHTEPPPPPASYELTSAAPGARGARAAGTDAAPPAVDERELAAPDPGDPSAEDESDGGTVSDGGLSTDAAPGVAL
jgi:hypothetical protein